MCEIQLPLLYFMYVLAFGPGSDSCSEEYQRFEMLVVAYQKITAPKEAPEPVTPTLNGEPATQEELQDRFAEALRGDH